MSRITSSLNVIIFIYFLVRKNNNNLLLQTVPNVSFEVYAPGFIERFFESHAVMLQGNAGLKPKEGEVTSRPWQWPLNYRVSVTAFYVISNQYVQLPIVLGTVFLRE